MQAKNDYSSYILPVGVVFILYLAAKKFGLVPDTGADKKETEQLFSDYTNPRYVTELIKSGQGKKVYLLPQATAQNLAVRIYKAKGLFNDDEDALYSAVKALKYKSQVSQTAGKFLELYKKDMAAYLQSFLNENELSKIFDFWQKLPTGKI